MKCHKCKDRQCYAGKNCTAFRDEIVQRCSEDEPTLTQLKAAASIESDFYMQMTRLEETMEFARRIKADHLGVAFCVGFVREAETLCALLEEAGFKVSSAICKICGIDKHELDLQKLWNRDIEATCNPMGQAEALNRDGTGLNIALGLCVGHDAIFMKHSEAPATTLVVKDRVLGHNPVAALYSGYYKRKFAGELKR